MDKLRVITALPDSTHLGPLDVPAAPLVRLQTLCQRLVPGCALCVMLGNLVRIPQPHVRRVMLDMWQVHWTVLAEQTARLALPGNLVPIPQPHVRRVMLGL